MKNNTGNCPFRLPVFEFGLHFMQCFVSKSELESGMLDQCIDIKGAVGG